MKVIDNQTAEILSLGEATLEEGKKIVEIAGRTCYKSLNLITEGSAEKFVFRMIESEHLSTLEHCTIYLKLPRKRETMHCSFHTINIVKQIVMAITVMLLLTIE